MLEASPRVQPLASRLRQARFDANLSQAELAEQLGCSARALQHWEYGRVTPRPSSRRRILAFIDFVDGKAGA